MDFEGNRAILNLDFFDESKGDNISVEVWIDNSLKSLENLRFGDWHVITGYPPLREREAPCLMG